MYKQTCCHITVSLEGGCLIQLLDDLKETLTRATISRSVALWWVLDLAVQSSVHARENLLRQKNKFGSFWGHVFFFFLFCFYINSLYNPICTDTITGNWMQFLLEHFFIWALASPKRLHHSFQGDPTQSNVLCRFRGTHSCKHILIQPYTTALLQTLNFNHLCNCQEGDDPGSVSEQRDWTFSIKAHQELKLICFITWS